MMDEFAHLWSSPIAEITLYRRQLKKLMLQTGGSILCCGQLWDLKAEHLGAGVYRVRKKLREYA